jgi:Heterokaryon incompatibility protein (HET)
MTLVSNTAYGEFHNWWNPISKTGFRRIGADYEYGPLDPRSNEIRLLKIERSLRSKAPILCHLQVVSLDDASLPEYAALSYCWGDGSADKPIDCDGATIWITEDLLDALRSLRKLTRKYLWIDQVCINQADLEERGSQVQLMRRIYPGAVQTFLHLGHSDEFPQLLAYYTKYFRGFMQPGFLSQLLADPWTFLAMLLWLPKLLLNYLGGVEYKSELHAYNYRPCFARAWILQEVSLSPKVQVICRNTAIRWDQFAQIVYEYFGGIVSEEGQVPVRANSHGSFLSFNHIIDTVKYSDRTTLLKLLSFSKEMTASDPRDRIYALLALASDALELPRPDYTLSVAAVYESFAAALIDKGYGPDILALASSGAKNHSYPSWVPAWEQTSVGLRLQELSTFSAGRDLGLFNVSAGTSILSTQGLIVDTILKVLPPHIERASNDIAMFAELFAELLKLVRSTSTAIRTDPAVLESPFSYSSVADLHLILIQHLVLDYNGGTFFDESLPIDKFQFDGHFKRELSTPEAPLLDADPSHDEDSDTLSEVLSDHLRRIHRQKGFYVFGCLQKIAQRGRFAITVTGRLCLLLTHAQAGDRIAIILGCRAPYVLRGDGDRFFDIGETYIRGLMHGEALDDESYTVQDILIR